MFGHPWRWLRGHPEITVEWCDDLPLEVMGVAEFATNTIRLARGLTQAERRVAVHHERIHLARGAVPAHLAAREERTVERIVARDLIPFEALLEAMLWSLDDHEIADELTVDVALVRARLEGLTPAESQLLERSLLDHEQLNP